MTKPNNNNNNDKCFRIVFLTKIGNSNWIITKKQFCDNVKENETLLRKSKSMIDRKNNNSSFKEHKIILDEFVNSKWTEIEQYPENQEKKT